MKVEFYTGSEGKTLNPELFAAHAEAWAKRVCESGLKGDKLEKNKISQLRKFYDKVLTFGEYLRSGEDYNSILPYIKMLNANAAYAEGRNLITGDFKSFLKQSLDYLGDNDPATFKVFASFFEAFMGYYKFYESHYKG